MKRIIIFLAVIAMSLSIAIGQQHISKTIYFNSDVHLLNKKNQNQLQKFGKQLENYSDYDITIVGHTDQDGNEDYNLKLSKNRALSVQNFFIEQGLESDQIQIGFEGEKKLAETDHSLSAKKLNRRVIIIANTYQFENSNELLSKLEDNNVTEKIIDPNFENKLELKKGTVIKIPANAFCLEDGTSVSENDIEINFKEAFDYLDMINLQLSTVTKDDILETGGMLYIEANQNGNKLRLKDNMMIDITYPIQDSKEDMELFYANENEDRMVWEAANQKVNIVQETPEKFMVQIPLDDLINYDFGELEKPTIDFDEMPRFPRPVKKAYPPSDRIYTTEKYKEVYDKYLVAKAKYEKDQESYDYRLQSWKSEVKLRKQKIRSHKRKLKKYYILKRCVYAVKVLDQRKSEASHEDLLNEVFGFLSETPAAIPFNEKYLIKMAFGNVTKDVKEQMGLAIFPSYDNHRDRSYDYCRNFNLVLGQKKDLILAKKYDLGYIDNLSVQKYAFRTSNLGWINCDRFTKLKDSQKTTFAVSNPSNEDKYFLVFKNQKSILQDSNDKGKVFRNIPKGEDVQLIGIRVINNKPYIASHEFKTGSIKKLEPQFKKSTMVAIKNTINNIASE